MLSRFVITFFPRSKHLLISWLQSPSAVILELPQNKICYCFHCFPNYLERSDGTESHDLSFLDIGLYINFFTLLFHFHQEALEFSSSLSAIRVVSSAYLRLLLFLPVILIPACASSSSAFLMMYSEYKLNREGDNLQLWHTHFPICSSSLFHVQF